MTGIGLGLKKKKVSIVVSLQNRFYVVLGSWWFCSRQTVLISAPTVVYACGEERVVSGSNDEENQKLLVFFSCYVNFALSLNK